MSKFIVKTELPADFLNKTSKDSKRGARVTGVPMSREITSYIEDVSPDIARQRLFAMFFGGSSAPAEGEQLEFLSEFDLFDSDEGDL